MGIASDLLRQRIQEARAVTQDWHLSVIADTFERIESTSASDAFLSDRYKEACQLLSNPHMATDAVAVEKFLQLFGEVDTYASLKCCGLHVVAVPTAKGKKTPDLKITANGHDLYCEVKTLSLVSGAAAIRRDLESGMESALSIESQLRTGKAVAIGESVVQPYGDATYENGRNIGALGTSRVLIEKARQNVKTEQFALGPTVLVLNLAMLPPARTELRSIRPCFPEIGNVDGQFCVSGDLWMLGFGHPEQLIHEIPEFEGGKAIFGKLEKQGLLVEHPFIKAILLRIYPLSSPPFWCGLLRYHDWDTGFSDNPALEEVVIKFLQDRSGEKVRYRWNDEFDSMGFDLP